jgi:hypothetical protein
VGVAIIPPRRNVRILLSLSFHPFFSSTTSDTQFPTEPSPRPHRNRIVPVVITSSPPLSPLVSIRRFLPSSLTTFPPSLHSSDSPHSPRSLVSR